MSRFKVREFAVADYSAISKIDKILVPGSASTVEQYLQADRLRDSRLLRARWVAEVAGDVVGYTLLSHHPYFYHPRRFRLGVKVLPDFRENGIGTALFESAIEKMRTFDPEMVNASVTEINPAGLKFATAKGFHESYRVFPSALDLISLEREKLFAMTTSPISQGIKIVPLCELVGDPEYRQKIYDLETIIVRDIPLTEERAQPPLSEFWKSVERDCPDLRSFFVALDGDVYVGMHFIFHGDDPLKFYISSTGVRPEYRKRGICSALKARGALYAADTGATELNTFNDSQNLPILKLNEKFGFVKKPAEIVFRKTY